MDGLPMIPPEAVGEEMTRGDLGDQRLEDRCGGLAELLASNPADEFPEAVGDHAELEALYRFWRHPRTGCQSVLEPHQEATSRRVADSEGPTLVVHDTTCFEFGERYRPGLGSVEGGDRFGFYAHLTLAVEAQGPKLPHGLLEAQVWRRAIPEDVSEEKRDPSKDCLPQKEDEGKKWLTGVGRAEKRLDDQEIIHVMDRGADSYERLSELVENDCRFVLRVQQNRRVCNDIEGCSDPKLEDALQEAPVKLEKTIELGARDQTGRPPHPKKVHPSRPARSATVEVRARKVEIAKPVNDTTDRPEGQTLRIVWVREVDPPEDGEPLDWRLYTSESIDDEEAIEQILEYYQRRWVIEEFNGILKGACRIEERQLESAETLTTALGVMIPAAWRLLALRTMVRNAPAAPAEQWMRRSQIEVLVEEDKTDIESAEGVSVREAWFGIAALGGHLPANGPPGWKVLYRGYAALRSRELAWRAGHISGATAMQERLEQLAHNVDDLDELKDQLETLEPDSDL